MELAFQEKLTPNRSHHGPCPFPTTYDLVNIVCRLHHDLLDFHIFDRSKGSLRRI